MELPAISVIIPVRNEGPFIAQTLRAIIAQDYPKDLLEILVVDGMSEDHTVAAVESLATSCGSLRLYPNPARISSAARNIGVRNSTGDIVLFIDGHVHIGNDQILKQTARLMHDRNVSVLSRPQFLETPGNAPLQNTIAYARRSWFGHGLDSTIFLNRDAYVGPASSGAAYRREVFEQVGYFDEHFDASEDYEFNYRLQLAGYKSFTSPALAVYYYPRATFRGLFRQMYRYGLGRFRLARKHPSTISPASLAPAVLTLGLAFLPMAVATRTLPMPIALLSMVYPLFVVLFALRIAFHKGAAHFPPLLLVFPTIHVGLGIGYLAGFLETVASRRFK